MLKDDLQRKLRQERGTTWNVAIRQLTTLLLWLEGGGINGDGKVISDEDAKRASQYLSELKEAFDALST